MSVTADRTTIANAVITALVNTGKWGPKVRSTDDYMLVPPDWMHTPPFCQIQDQDTDFLTNSTAVSKMVYPILIAFYADLGMAHWTLTGRSEDSIRKVQDDVRTLFLRGDLGGLVDRTEVTQLLSPRPLPVLAEGSDEPGGFLIAGARLMITVNRAG